MIDHKTHKKLMKASDEAKEVPDPQVTISELIRQLSIYDDERIVGLDIDPTIGIEGLSSYRGYYEHLALVPEKFADTNVGELTTMLQNAVKTSFEGYKGGQYVMRDRTVVWVANWGQASAIKVSGVTFPRYHDHVILLTSMEQW